MKDIDIQYLKQFLNNPEENPSQGLPDGFNPIYVLQDIYKIANEYFGIEDEILSQPVIEGPYDFSPTFTIEKVEGISCGGRPTSCPDQLAQALKAAKAHL